MRHRFVPVSHGHVTRKNITVLQLPRTKIRTQALIRNLLQLKLLQKKQSRYYSVAQETASATPQAKNDESFYEQNIISKPFLNAVLLSFQNSGRRTSLSRSRRRREIWIDVLSRRCTEFARLSRMNILWIPAASPALSTSLLHGPLTHSCISNNEDVWGSKKKWRLLQRRLCSFRSHSRAIFFKLS